MSTRSRFIPVAPIASLAFLLLAASPLVRSQSHVMQESDGGRHAMSMKMSAAPTAGAQLAKILADKRESEFDHHLAGVFVLVAGFFILAEGSIRERWPGVRFVWPACFLLAGTFVLVYSDTELWPFGPQSWFHALATNPEDLQHKIFALLLLGLGIVEFQRARGVLKNAWASWVFPVLAIVGSGMLLFHQHAGGMHGPNHIETMARIRSEHLDFALTGFGIGLTKAFAELRTNWRHVFGKLWPVFMIILGVLLMLYKE